MFRHSQKGKEMIKTRNRKLSKKLLSLLMLLTLLFTMLPTAAFAEATELRSKNAMSSSSSSEKSRSGFLQLRMM